MSLGIIFEVYAPLGSPQRYGKGEEEPDPLQDPIIKEIATKHGVTVAQVCVLVWCDKAYLWGGHHVTRHTFGGVTM